MDKEVRLVWAIFAEPEQWVKREFRGCLKRASFGCAWPMTATTVSARGRAKAGTYFW